MKQEKFEINPTAVTGNNEASVVESDRTKLEDLSAEQLAQYEEYMARNSEAPILETKRESGPEILEVEALIAKFESEISVEELTMLNTAKEALASPLREKAKEEIKPILKIIQTLKKETNIGPDKLEELEVKYRRLSRAIGMINSGKVDHNR